MEHLRSATKAYIKFANAIEGIAESLDQTSNSFKEVTNRIKSMAMAKNAELDRMLYLKEIQKYSGYKISDFADIKNIDGTTTSTNN